MKTFFALIVLLAGIVPVSGQNDDWWKMPGTQKANPRKADVASWHTPQIACSLLDDIPGMQTTGYKDYAMRSRTPREPWMPKEYSCLSPYKQIGSGWPMPNNLAFYSTGDQSIVRELKLVLNVNNAPTAEVGHGALAVASSLLTKRALNGDLSDEVLEALLAGRQGKWKAGKNQIEILREDWPTGKGYEVKFIIR